MKSKDLWWAGKILLSLLLIYWVFTKFIDIDDLSANIKKLSLTIFFANLAMELGRRYMIANQIKYVITLFGMTAKTIEVFRVQIISSFYGFMIPGGVVSAGITWYQLSKNNNKASVASILTFLRINNLMLLIPFAVWGLLAQPKLQNLGIHYIILLFVILLAIMAIPFTSTPAIKTAENFFTYLLNLLRLQRYANQAGSIWLSLSKFKNLSIKNKGIISVQSLLNNTYSILCYYAIGLSCGIKLPFDAYLWIFPMLTILMIIPITIGGIGVRDIGVIYLFNLYGISEEQSILFSFYLLFISIVIVLTGGILNMIKK